jgi:uncharacterized protein (TIGR02145 family)
MKRTLILIFITGLSFLSSCELTVNKEITTDYLVNGMANGTLDPYLQHNQIFRYKGKPGVVTIPIGLSNLSDYEKCFVLYVSNGSDPATAVSSASVKLDGTTVLAPTDFSNKPVLYKFEICDLTLQSSLEVEVKGNPGSYVDLWIEGKLSMSGTFTDERDGHVYKWVKICGKKWMAENLAYLPTVSPLTERDAAEPSLQRVTTPINYVYGYNGYDPMEAKTYESYKTYGVLYNWPAAMQGEMQSNTVPSGVRGISPKGWHIPSDAEFKELTDCLGGDALAAGKLKEAGFLHWIEPNAGANNESKFTGLPGGFRTQGSGVEFTQMGEAGFWWASTERNEIDAWALYLNNNMSNLLEHVGSYTYMGYALSIRCVEDY